MALFTRSPEGLVNSTSTPGKVPTLPPSAATLSLPPPSKGALRFSHEASMSAGHPQAALLAERLCVPPPLTVYLKELFRVYRPEPRCLPSCLLSRNKSRTQETVKAASSLPEILFDGDEGRRFFFFRHVGEEARRQAQSAPPSLTIYMYIPTACETTYHRMTPLCPDRDAHH